ncbi:MAG: 2-amino-5-chlorophenol 1,6-dioxygenase subunit alpha [Acidimicrobiales bacterium]
MADRADGVVVAAALVPGFPHLLAHNPAPSWKALGEAAAGVGDEIRRAGADALLMISTQWFTVLGHQFQVDPNPRGRHVDENWYDFDFGRFDFDIHTDVELTTAWAGEAERDGFQTRLTNYAHFPIDTGTLTAKALLDPDERLPVSLMSVNLYAGETDVRGLGAAARRAATALGRRVAVVAVSGLSSGWTNRWITPDEDRFERADHDEWNRRLLDLLAEGQVDEVLGLRDEYAAACQVDSQFRALPFLVGAASVDGPAEVTAYGPVWGAGAAVVTWRV